MNNKLSYKLITYILIISFTITSISLYINLNKTYNDQIQQFEKNLNNIQKNRLDILSQSLWDVNETAINIFLKNMLNNDNIIYAKIIENDNNIYEIGSHRNKDVIKKEFNIYKQFKNENYYIGKLIIIADLRPLYQKLQSNAITIIIEELIKIFLISLLIIFFIKQFLTNNLEKMANYANNLNLDNLNVPLKIKEETTNKNDEIDIVANAINKMRTNLQHQLERSREKDTILAHQSKMAAMGEMIGNIAHQWRQPLSVISTAATGIKVNKEIGVYDEKQVLDTMDAINESAQYLSTTIDDFRDFFKPEKKKQHFYINNVINKALSLVSQQFKNKEIEIIQNIENAEIFGFENELIQVFINLLNNAKDELVTLKQEKKLIFIESNIHNHQLIITIKDNANGVKEELLSRIFEPYFTTKSKNLGTGIGLYICEEIIVKHMKGAIKVTNQTYTYKDIEYRGAQFTITLNCNTTQS